MPSSDKSPYALTSVVLIVLNIKRKKKKKKKKKTFGSGVGLKRKKDETIKGTLAVELYEELKKKKIETKKRRKNKVV